MHDGPLSGLLVADFSRVLAGPYATMTLGDLGATVIKVERPGTGDDTRAWGPPWNASGTSAYFLSLNRNKHSVALDLDRADDLYLAHQLVRLADAVVVNFRPGSIDRFGLDYASVAVLNPAVVYCSITGYGTAPAAGALAGYDLVVQAVSGLMSITGVNEPTKIGVALVDHIAGLQATVGILAALLRRAREPQAQLVEVSLLGSALTALLNQAAGYLADGSVPGPSGNRHPSIAPYQAFNGADGHFVVACGNDQQFAALCRVTGLERLRDDARFLTNADRVANVDALTDELEIAFAGASIDSWVTKLNHAGVPAGPINDLAAAFRHAAHLGLDAIIGSGDQRTVRSPIILSSNPAVQRLPAPALDEHGDTIRQQLRTGATADDLIAWAGTIAGTA
jgi:crotonobetainyl-CoA:carnitine CoA-transferase CaiB-like acyl-CoA transferase